MTISEKIDEMMASGAYEQVEQYLADEKAKAEAMMDEAMVFSVINEQIGYFRSIGNHTKSIAACEAMLGRLKDGSVPEDESCAVAWVNVATAYRAAGMLEEAITMYGEALSVFSQVESPDPQKLAALHNNMAHAMLLLGRNSRAELCLESAIDLLKDCPGCESEYAISCTNLGVLYLRGNKFEDGEALLKTAETAFSNLDYEDPHYAATLAALAMLCYMNKDYTAAVDKYMKSMELTEKFFGRNDDYIVSCKNCIAAASAAGNEELAESLKGRLK